MHRNRDLERPNDSAEDEADLAHSFPYQVWGLGIVVPSALLLFGLYCLRTNTAWFINVKDPAAWWELDNRYFFHRVLLAEYHGASAVGLVIAYICTAIDLHFHVFWSFRKRFEPYADLAKTLAGIGIGGGLVVFIFSLFWTVMA